jgi:hypothetical protein
MGFGKLKAFNKYGSKRVEFDGISFASKLEADVYKMLSGDSGIKTIETQRTISLTEAAIKYRVDFIVTTDKDHKIAVEAKGMETDRYKIIKKLYAHYGPMPLMVYKRKGKDGLKLFEVIVPKHISQEQAGSNMEPTLDEHARE